MSLKENLPRKILVKPENHEEISIFIPTKEQLEKEDIEILHQRLTENHQKIFSILLGVSFPYFGLHGTSKQSAEEIVSKGAGILEIVTFYTKEKTEEFLYKLYHAASFVTSYASRNKKTNERRQKGSILVFNLEKEGQNTTAMWEHLGLSAATYMTLGFDSEKETSYRENLHKTENLLFRSTCYPPDRSITGVISLESFDQLVEKLNVTGPEAIARHIIQYRFCEQEIIYRVLGMFKTGEK